MFCVVELLIGLEAGHTQIMSIGLRCQVRTYPSHSSVLYTLNLKHTGCEYATIQASSRGFRHLLCYMDTAYVSGQMGTAEPNKKTSISGSKSKTLEQSRVDQNNGNKNRKRCDDITPSHMHQSSLNHQMHQEPWLNLQATEVMEMSLLLHLLHYHLSMALSLS
jgi:hypothetical protein